VYFHRMQSVLTQGKQVLLLVPEISLTPQLLDQVERFFSEKIVVLHSSMGDRDRHISWWHAHQGEARIIIGTRSAIFSSLPDLGLIVVDEEHDGSFKQHEGGIHYHARDVAIYRAKQSNVLRSL